LKVPAVTATKAQLQVQDPDCIINNVLIPALDEIGTRFEEGTLFLPQLLQSAGAAQAAFDVIRAALSTSGRQSSGKGTIVLAAVKGDIHDIGKNIVKTLLENYGYDIIDLGRDVPVNEIVRAVREHAAPLVGLSALMTTTLTSMEETTQCLA
ncbi:protein containing Cobalamin (vitamin B12)-binding protein, partial [gut metagenome]